MRALLLFAVAVIGCGGGGDASAPLNPSTCQVWVYPPSLLPYLWTCTSGTAAAYTDGRPDHVPCVLSTEPKWSLVDGGTAVPSCAECTPAQLLALDPHARCTPLGEDEAPAWSPPDIGPVIGPPATAG
jgi:hypothetical protein